MVANEKKTEIAKNAIILYSIL